jgi:hypothetical protein
MDGCALSGSFTCVLIRHGDDPFVVLPFEVIMLDGSHEFDPALRASLLTTIPKQFKLLLGLLALTLGISV